MTEGEPEATEGVIARGIPLGRIGTGEEVATAIASLLSDDASYIVGAHLAVDGGFPRDNTHPSQRVSGPDR
jgi:NAD(P)-dependent dehydrogenase (short-subunit alcohol dehydrogenase family)